MPVSEKMVKNFIMASPTKSCRLDPVPTFLLKKVLCPLVPTITKIVNLSLSTGTFPAGMKHAMVTPLLKKPTLDARDLGNYRPVSNLSLFLVETDREDCHSSVDGPSRNLRRVTPPSICLPTKPLYRDSFDCHF